MRPSRFNKPMLWVQYQKYFTGSNDKREGLLGVTIDWDLNFHTHVSIAVTKHQDDTSQAILLFTTMVDHQWEYGNVIWCPRFRHDKLKVGKIQRRDTKLIPNLRSLSYIDRLEALGVPSLYYCRR